MRSALRVRGLCVRVISRKGRGAPVLSASTFNTESLKLLGVLKRALEPIVPLNTGFSLTVSADGRQLEMDMGVKGAYVFTADSSTERVRMQSPVSGVFSYHFDPVEQLWLGDSDKHDLRGIVTRDVLRHCIGCPAF